MRRAPADDSSASNISLMHGKGRLCLLRGADKLFQAEVEEAWAARSVQLRRGRLADEEGARLAQQRMQDAQARAAQQQRERQERDAALQAALLPEHPHHFLCHCDRRALQIACLGDLSGKRHKS